MGDSATYLWSAVGLHIPPDRSFTLSVADSSNSRHKRFDHDVALGAIVVRRGDVDDGVLASSPVFAVRPWIAAVAALLVALDPSQLFYERMVMTESVSTCVLVASLCAAFAYHASSENTLSRLMHFARSDFGQLARRAGALCAGARSGGCSAGESPDSMRACVRPLLLAIIATWTCHSAYQHAYGRLTHSHPGYIRDGGFFRLGLVAPLVTSASFEGTGLDASLLDDVKIPLEDPHLREAQIWQPGGLIDVLQTPRRSACLPHRRRDWRRTPSRTIPSVSFVWVCKHCASISTRSIIARG